MPALSLRAKLILGTLLIQIAILTAITFNANRIAQGFLVEQVRLRIESTVPLMNAAIAGPIAQHDYVSLNEILADISRTQALTYVVVFDQEGHQLAQIGSAAKNGAGHDAKRDGYLDKGFAVTINGTEVGQAHFGISITFLQEAERSLTRQNGIIALTGLMMAVGLLSLLGWWITRQLHSLRLAAERIRDGNYDDPGIRTRDKDELGQLANSFDTMREKIMEARQSLLKEIEEHKRTEAELERYHSHLEELVDLRTIELAAAKDAAEFANRAKSTFLANMSHEIRTPLHAITGMAHLIRKSGVPAEQAERLDRIDAASAHLLDIINDVLDFSKIEAGKIHLEEVPLSVGAIMDNVRSMIAEAAATKGLEVRLETRPVPDRLVGDATRLKQALLNYASNAIKFTEKGSVTLAATLVHEAEDSAVIRFEVADTGIGIPAEVVPKLFAAFVQADSSTTREFGGTGLGLVIARKIAEMMDGNVGVESALGVGSTFWFTARLKRGQARGEAVPHAPAESPEAVLKHDYKGLRILVADDDPDNRYITQHLLNEVWPNIDLAEDGVQAVEMAAKTSYDVILMDMRMPRMDGLEATRRIRQLPQGGNALILALTANVFPEDRAQCIDAGMNDLIPKATGAEAPFTTILQWLAKRGRPNKRLESV